MKTTEGFIYTYLSINQNRKKYPFGNKKFVFTSSPQYFFAEILLNVNSNFEKDIAFLA